MQGLRFLSALVSRAAFQASLLTVDMADRKQNSSPRYSKKTVTSYITHQLVFYASVNQAGEKASISPTSQTNLRLQARETSIKTECNQRLKRFFDLHHISTDSV